LVCCNCIVIYLKSLCNSEPVRKPGFLKEKINIAEDFDTPLPDHLLDAFEGRAPLEIQNSKRNKPVLSAFLFLNFKKEFS